MIIVDASVLVELLLNNPEATAVERRLLKAGEALHAPHLIDIEVLHAIRRYARTRVLTARRAEEALTELINFPLERHPHHRLLARIWALRDNLTAYDATYIALAELLEAPLVTRDQRLAHSSGHRAKIELV